MKLEKSETGEERVKKSGRKEREGERDWESDLVLARRPVAVSVGHGLLSVCVCVTAGEEMVSKQSRG